MLEGDEWEAAKSGSIPYFVNRVTQGFPLDSHNEEGRTVLHLAAQFGRSSLVSFLLMSQKIPINAIDYEGKTPLHLAIESKMNECVDYLVTQGANLVLQDADGKSCLSLLSSSRAEELKHKASPGQLLPIYPLPKPPSRTTVISPRRGDKPSRSEKDKEPISISKSFSGDNLEALARSLSVSSSSSSSSTSSSPSFSSSTTN